MELSLYSLSVSPEWSDPETIVPVVQWHSPERTAQNVRDGRFRRSDAGTWGPGIYVAAAHTPLSAAHYGQACAWARLRIGHVFDASITENVRTFLRWAGRPDTPIPWGPLLLSRAADQFCQILRPQPNVVAFHPDEFNEHTRSADIWFLVRPAATSPFGGIKFLLGITEVFRQTEPGLWPFQRENFSVDPATGRLTIGP